MANTKTKTSEDIQKSVNENIKKVVEANLPKKEEMVTIRLPRDREDQEDQVVWVNDRRFLIQRGKYVDVPVSVALVLQESERQMERIYEFEDKNKK